VCRYVKKLNLAELNYIIFIIHADCVIGGIDLVFVLDVSISIRAKRFPLIKDFVTKISRRLDVGPENSLVGVILFGGGADIYFSLQENLNQTELLTAIAEIPYLNWRETYTDRALNLLLDGARSGRLGLRNGYPNVAIVVTDGKSTSKEGYLNQAAMALHSANLYQVYAAGVGSGVDFKELKLIASDSSLAFSIENFDLKAIEELEQRVSDQLCNQSCMFRSPYLG